MHSERSLVLGAAGFLGTTLCHCLVQQGQDLVAMDRADSPRLRAIGVSQWVVGDFQDGELLQGALEQCDAVYHLISTTTPSSSNRDPIADCQTNVISSLRLLELARRHGIRKVVFLSSGGTVYGIPTRIPVTEAAPTNPICSYGIHKLAIEKYLRLYQNLYGLDCCILRVSNPYGPFQRSANDQGVVGVFIGKALRGERIEVWGDGSVIRDYVHADDVAEAMIKAMSYEGQDHIFNIGSGEGRSLREIIELIARLMDKSIPVSYGPARDEDVPINVLDVSKAKRELGWQPKTPFESGVAMTFRHLQQLHAKT